MTNFLIFSLPNNKSNDDSSSSSSQQLQQQQQNLTSEEFLLAFKWSDLDHLFYFFNEELANLNRRLLVKPSTIDSQTPLPANNNQVTGSSELDNNIDQLFGKLLNLLKCIFVLSK